MELFYTSSIAIGDIDTSSYAGSADVTCVLVGKLPAILLPGTRLYWEQIVEILLTVEHPFPLYVGSCFSFLTSSVVDIQTGMSVLCNAPSRRDNRSWRMRRSCRNRCLCCLWCIRCVHAQAAIARINDVTKWKSALRSPRSNDHDVISSDGSCNRFKSFRDGIDILVTEIEMVTHQKHGIQWTLMTAVNNMLLIEVDLSDWFQIQKAPIYTLLEAFRKITMITKPYRVTRQDIYVN